MTLPYRVVQLDPTYDRSAFSCGSPPLDRYIREQASQDVRRLVTKCFVILEHGALEIAGFYTLAASSVPIDLLPDGIKRKLPRYPSVPVVRMGRLAVDRRHHGNKLGARLVADAVLRSMRAEIGAVAMMVDAKDDAAEAFYIHHGFITIGTRQLLLAFPKS